MQRIILILILLISPTLCHAGRIFLPELGDSSRSHLTPSKEREMGSQYIHQLAQTSLLVTDPVVNDYIQTLGNRLVKASGSKKEFHFFVVKDPEINAFAGPSGYIGINSGLIINMESEDELAAVMAHEIAHVTQNHLARTMEIAETQRIPAMAAIVGAIALGSINPALGSGALAATTAGYWQNELNWSRDHEREADRVGSGILYRAGFAPQAMPKALQHIERLHMFAGEDMPESLKTHPHSHLRVADVDNRAAQFPKRAYSTNLLYDLILARIRLDMNTDLVSMLDYFHTSAMSNLGSTNNQKIASQYGYALTQLALRNAPAAKETAQELVKQLPKQSQFAMVLAEAAALAHEKEIGLTELQKAYANNPTYFPLLMQYARTLYEEGEFIKAKEFIADAQRKFPRKPALYFLRARIQAKLGDLSEAYLSQAKFYELVGNKNLALRQLQQASKVPKQTQDTRAIVEARANELKKKGDLESFVFN